MASRFPHQKEKRGGQTMSKETRSDHGGHAAYLDAVNIQLFNYVVAFVMSTSSADAADVRRSLENRHLWYAASYSDSISEQYGFRYLGELLERYEDKAGSDIRDICAIALAMAYTTELHSSTMFVGGQKQSFIKRITRISDGDVYLKGALYLLFKKEPTGDDILAELTKSPYSETEALIFVMSLFDDFEHAISVFKNQLIWLLGAARTMPVFGNTGIYAWIIRNIYPLYKEKGLRSKELALLRALIELPVSFVKAGSRYHSVLLEHGYTAGEIVYLNSTMIEYRPVPGTILEASIVGERIAISYCTIFINSEQTHHPAAYEELSRCLIAHKDFAIKLGGNKGIFYAIEADIKITNPQTFLWLFRLLFQSHQNIFRFDILEEKWDILSTELSQAEYRELFENQLLWTRLDSSQVRNWIQKYDLLTGASYTSFFSDTYDRYKDDMFRLLVANDLIDPVSAFKACSNLEAIRQGPLLPERDKPAMLLYLRDYIKGITTRKAFDLFQYIFKNYSFSDMFKWFVDDPSYESQKNLAWFFRDPLYKGPAHYHNDSENRFGIKKDFLSREEHQTLYGWLDDYMFQYDAEKYIEFTVLMLLDSFVSSLHSREELRQIFDMVIVSDAGTVKENQRALKSKYLTEVEIQAERDNEEAKNQKFKQAAREVLDCKLRDELDKKYDNTFKSLLKYLDNHEYSFQDSEEALPIAAERLIPTLESCSYQLGGKEIGRFLEFGGQLLKKGAISFKELKKLIIKVEEATEDVQNASSCENDSDDE
jgi:hypothetical protein